MKFPHNTILEMIACGKPLTSAMQYLCLEVEVRLPDLRCAVFTVDRAGILHLVAAPSLSQELLKAINGSVLRSMLPERVTPAACGWPVIVGDITGDS